MMTPQHFRRPHRKEGRLGTGCMSVVDWWWVVKGNAFVGFYFYRKARDKKA